MWIRWFKISDGTTVKTQYFTDYRDAVSAAKRYVLTHPECDWEGM